MKRNALITGGSRGIGLGIAMALALEGWNLAINGVRDESQVDSLKELKDEGVKVWYCQGDISSSTSRQEIINKALDGLGSINVLVNNAGIAPKDRSDLLDISEDSYDRVLNTNLRGTFFLTQLVARKMIQHKSEDPDFQACIINISSISATLASPERGQYCISKAGMSMLTKLFAIRLGQHNIPVFEIRPGIIATDMTSGVKEKYDKKIAEGLTVAGRWGQPEDVGKAVKSLVCGDLNYSTGQVLMVDGGLTIERL
ncbi:MAG: 3-ketoacyl-ACP reductase [Saprospiraceae bacterium]|nr:3-ketoacyl-ACP reductase [Saprospiraceae bacterium]